MSAGKEAEVHFQRNFKKEDSKDPSIILEGGKTYSTRIASYHGRGDRETSSSTVRGEG